MSATFTPQCPASPITIQLVQFQHNYFTKAEPNPGLQRTIQVHLMGRAVALTTAFLLHAEAVIKAVYSAFLMLGSVFAHSLKETLAQRQFESKTALTQSWKSMRSVVSAKPPLLIAAAPVQSKIPDFIISAGQPALPTKVIEIKEQETQTIAYKASSKPPLSQHKAPFEFVSINLDATSAPSLAASQTYDKLSELSLSKNYPPAAASLAASDTYDKLSDISLIKNPRPRAPSLAKSMSFDRLSQDLSEIETKDQATQTTPLTVEIKPSLETWVPISEMIVKNYSIGVCEHKKSPTQQWLVSPEDIAHPFHLFALLEPLGTSDICSDIQDNLASLLTTSLKKHNLETYSEEGIRKAIEETCLELTQSPIPADQFSLTSALVIEKDVWIFNIGKSGAMMAPTSINEPKIWQNPNGAIGDKKTQIFKLALRNLSGANLFLGTSTFYTKENRDKICTILKENEKAAPSITAQSLCKALKQEVKTAAAMVIQIEDWEVISSDSDFEKV